MESAVAMGAARSASTSTIAIRSAAASGRFRPALCRGAPQAERGPLETRRSHFGASAVATAAPPRLALSRATAAAATAAAAAHYDARDPTEEDEEEAQAQVLEKEKRNSFALSQSGTFKLSDFAVNKGGMHDTPDPKTPAGAAAPSQPAAGRLDVKSLDELVMMEELGAGAAARCARRSTCRRARSSR